MNSLQRVHARGPSGLERSNASPAASLGTPTTSFADVLRGSLRQPSATQSPGAVRFSAHAQERLASRAIAFTPDDHARIEKAVDQAALKGSRESLLLMDKVALVVSVPNRTVITAVGTNEAGNTVFTNIDSAVVVPGSPSSPPNETHPGPDPLRESPRAAERPMRRTETEN